MHYEAYIFLHSIFSLTPINISSMVAVKSCEAIPVSLSYVIPAGLSGVLVYHLL